MSAPEPTSQPPEPSAPSGQAERRALAARAAVVGAGTLLSRLLGLGREIVLAAVFRRAETDAFFVAFTIPNALRQLLGEGAVASAVVPVLAETRERQGDEQARAFFQYVRGVSIAALALVTALGMVFARELCELFAAGFHDRPGQFERTVEVTRWVFPYIFFMGTAALGMAALNTHRKFAVAAFSPALLNVAMIALSFGLPGWLLARGEDPTLALVAGALAGGALQVVAQWPALRSIGYLRRPRFDLGHPGVRRVFARLAPMLLGLGIYEIDLVLSRRFLSGLGEGAQSYFTWAMRLCDFPQGIFVLAISTAALPSLSSLAARGERDEVARTCAYGMRLALFVAIPATALFVALAQPLVIAFFERGQFGREAAEQTARALVAQGLGVWTVAAVRQLVPVYYALGDTRTPVIVSAIDLGAFVALALGLRGTLGHVGVSVAVTGSSLVQMALLWALLGRRLPSLRLGEVAGSGARTLLAAALAAAAAVAAARWIGLPQGAGWVRRLLPALGGCVGFGAVFFAVAWAVRSPELRGLAEAVGRRVRGSQDR
jgi:putative peptidoglycan lipid II flippase